MIEIFMSEIEKMAFEGVSLSRRLTKGAPERGEMTALLRENRARHPAQGRITYAGIRGIKDESSDLIAPAATQAKKELGSPKRTAGASEVEMGRMKNLASHAPISPWAKAALVGIPAAGLAAGGAYGLYKHFSKKREE